MNLFLDAHQELLMALLKHHVDFIIIGGYAVIFHGYHRTTGDVDIWLKPDNQNKRKLMDALLEFGIEHTSLEGIANLNFEAHLAFHIGNEPDKIDFLTYISGVMYADADLQKVLADIGNIQVPFLHFNHLILSKIATGRLRDKADIEELQKIYQYKNR